MPLSIPFWQELRSHSRKEWPGIVRKYNLSSEEMKKANEIISTKGTDEGLFESVYSECLSVGLINTDLILEKYGIIEDGIKGRIMKKWLESK